MLNNFTEVAIEDIPVLYVEVQGVSNSGKAFNELEAKIVSLKGRRFYGTLLGDPYNGIYRACVEIGIGEAPNKLGLKEGLIPGGKYIRSKINDWNNKLDSIGKTFKELSEISNPDETRPCIEFYRSMKELVLYLPVKV